MLSSIVDSTTLKNIKYINNIDLLNGGSGNVGDGSVYYEKTICLGDVTSCRCDDVQPRWPAPDFFV